MKRYLLLVIISCLASPLFAQYVYTINADSVKITNHCDTAELIIENHTQNVPGFLFNKGRGRTEFRRGLFTIDDTLYMIGEDTLNLAKGLNALQANNGLLKTGNIIQFGNTDDDPYSQAAQLRNTYYYQGGSLFNWMTGGSNMFTVSKYQFSNAAESNVLRAYYLARFYSPQGGILMEGNVRPSYNGPLAWINFKNDDPNSKTFSFFGDQLVGSFNSLSVHGTDDKIYHPFVFTIANDTPTVANGTVLRLFPTHVYPFGAFKRPTATTTRLSVEDNISGCGNCVGALNVSNPYSSLVVDARNYPLVVGNLPSATGGHMLIVDDNGKVWKGDTAGSSPSAMIPGILRSSLAVNGDITAKKLTLSQTGWPDYVFDSAYRRPSLPELEQYIKQHNHLPEVPSAAEVTAKGIDVGNNQAALLKKIEELTLYLIEQGKELQTLKLEITALKKTNKN